MRKRFKPSAICSSSDYIRSKKAHRASLERGHQNFVMMVASGELKLSDNLPEITPTYVSVMIFGRERKMAYEDYMRACPEFKIVRKYY